LLQRFDDLGVFQHIASTIIVEAVSDVRIFYDVHQSTTVVNLANDILHDSIFDNVRGHVVDELLDAIVDAGH
jgi:hypothetical protein